MAQRRKIKRKRRRRLKKGFKVFLMVLLVIIVLVFIVLFGFKLQSVSTVTDLGQFTNQEINDYIKAKDIDNTLIFWLKSKTSNRIKLDLFEEYSVKINSPFKVTITAYEKKLKGYIKSDKTYYYFDENGTLLKISSKKLEDVPNVTGIECKSLKLYQKIDAKDKKLFTSLLNVVDAVSVYNYSVKHFDINKNAEITMHVKNIKVQLGKSSNIEKKLKDFNDMYANVIKYEGVLNMKHVSEDGNYTLKKGK